MPQHIDASKNNNAFVVSQHIDANKNTKAWAVSQHIDANKNTNAWALSQHTDASKIKRKKWVMRCVIIVTQELSSAMLCSLYDSIHRIHPTEMEAELRGYVKVEVCFVLFC